MKLKRVVLDTSAIVKWFVSEKESREMERLREMHLSGQIELCTCNFALIELANALRYATGIQMQDVLKAVEAVKALGLILVDELEILGKAIKLAFEYEITIYDALYVSLAYEMDSKIVTYDKVLLDKFPKKAVKASQLLSSFR